MNSDFMHERAEARAIAERLQATFQTLGLQHEPMDWQHAGRLAEVYVRGVRVGDLVSLEAEDQEEVLEWVRQAMMTDLAYKHLGLQRGGHVIHITPVLPEGEMTALAVIAIDDSVGIAIAEYLRDGQRIYAYYHDEEREDPYEHAS